MADLADGEQIEMKGSGATPYVIKNNGGIYSCNCPAWRNQSVPIDGRTCKHIKKLRGEAAEMARIGAAAASTPPKASSEGEEDGEGAPVLLAQAWENSQDLSGWWMSEKLDGVRAYWDGKSFVSRLGNRFLAPEWFAEGLPDHPLDGELWVGRKKFSETISTVRSGAAGERWRQIQYLVFDAPALERPFEERVEAVRAVISPEKTPFAKIVEQLRCDSLDHLRTELERIEGLGGEGLMMRQPGSRYEIGRSSTLLKVKRFFDAEARVVDHVEGAGKHKGRLGSVLVENADGVKFNVGTGFTDAQRKDPPPVGAIITFRYQELSKDGVPRFPSFVAVRTDSDGTAPQAPRKGAQKRNSRAESKAKAAEPPQSPAPVESPAKATAPQPPAASRRFECIEDSSSKFWEVSLEGESYTVVYGRIGSKGTRQSKTFPTPEAAAAAAEKLIREKLDKGYVEATETQEKPAPTRLESPPKIQDLLKELSSQVGRLKLTVAQDFPAGLTAEALVAAGMEQAKAERLAAFCASLPEIESVLGGHR